MNMLKQTQLYDQRDFMGTPEARCTLRAINRQAPSACRMLCMDCQQRDLTLVLDHLDEYSTQAAWDSMQVSAVSTFGTLEYFTYVGYPQELLGFLPLART